MSKSARSRPAGSKKLVFVQKPTGRLTPRVQTVGPEHFGIVSIDPAKARSCYMFCDFYGNILIEPTYVEHTRGALHGAIDRLRQGLQQHAVRDCIVAIERIQRMQKALELMNLKLTKVLSNIVGVTGLKIIQAIIKGERDPHKLARFRDRRCKHSVAEIVAALTGRYRAEHVLELALCFTMWQKYQEVIKKLDEAIEAHLQTMRRQSTLPPLPPRRKHCCGAARCPHAGPGRT